MVDKKSLFCELKKSYVHPFQTAIAVVMIKYYLMYFSWQKLKRRQLFSQSVDDIIICVLSMIMVIIPRDLNSHNHDNTKYLFKKIKKLKVVCATSCGNRKEC